MPTIDFAIFNELSAREQANGVPQAIEWIVELIDVMKRARRLGFRQLRTRDDFRLLNVTATKRIGEIIFSHLDRDRRELILRLQSSPYLNSEADEMSFLSWNVSSVAGETRGDAEGLLCGFVADALTVSFDTHVRWRTPEIPLTLQHDTTREIRSARVHHASQTEHLRQHVRWASRRSCSISEMTPQINQPLKNTQFSDQLVDNDWGLFFRETSALSPQEKTARLRGIADDVAFINGFDMSEPLSHKNHQHSGALRQIFISVYTRPGHEFYLSTDFEKAAGAFEAFDRNGRHLGEWLFSGSKNGDADGSGHHDIIVR